MVSRPKRDSNGKTDDERVIEYAKRDVWELARMLVELENGYAKLMAMKLAKGKR